MLNLWELKDWHFQLRQQREGLRAGASAASETSAPQCWEEAWDNDAELDIDELQSVPVYLPSPAEIRAACEEIQKGWTETERRQRLGITRATDSVYIPPRIRLEIPA